MTIVRTPTEDDYASATRGLNLMRVTDTELQRMVDHHSAIPLFASTVIAEAARRILSQRALDYTNRQNRIR
jgi:hypothetical protein